MSAREVIFLGTASQVPTRQRNQHALFLRWDDLGILFDPGEGTQRQMIRAGLSASQITHICITHFHGDHCLGLASLVQRISLDRVPHPVMVFYPRSGQIYFDRLRHACIFHDRAQIVPRPLAGPADADLVAAELPQAVLIARALDHRVDCYGYRLVERDGRRMLPERLAALGLRGARIGELVARGQVEEGGRTVRLEEVSVPRPGQRFAFVMDTRPCVGAEALADQADLLVCESTYLSSEERLAHDYYHMTAAQAGQLARRAGVRRLVLTHFSERYPHGGPLREEAAAFHDDVLAADDLITVRVPPRR
ncbi:MAG: ribonuclease Z [Myxococcales bacterium]|nr:ribonuclease Z [Myxococcota bacterium]MDW8282319.1 ribonuclease Z [Myxococcales bacterium]